MVLWNYITSTYLGYFFTDGAIMGKIQIFLFVAVEHVHCSFVFHKLNFYHYSNRIKYNWLISNLSVIFTHVRTVNNTKVYLFVLGSIIWDAGNREQWKNGWRRLLIPWVRNWQMKKLRTDHEVVLDQCPQQADYWDLIFHTVLEWSDLVKYNFIMFISID